MLIPSGPETLIFSDLHGGLTIRDSLTQKIKTHGSKYRETLYAIRELLVRRNINRIINMGDTGTSRGDDTNHEVVEELQEVFSEFELHGLLGNHCVGSAGGNRLAAKGLYRSDTPKIIDLGHMSGILLDIMFGEKSARLPCDTLDWLQSEVDKLTRDAAVFCHYPTTQDPDNTTYYHLHAPERAFLENSEVVREILEGNNHIKRYFNGHTHMPFQKSIGGVIHRTIPSVSESIDGKIDGRVGIFNSETNSLELVKIDM